MNGVVHAYVVKQLTNLEIVHSLRSFAPKLSKSKQSWKFVKVIKIGGSKSPLIPPIFDHSRRENHKLFHIVESEQKPSTSKALHQPLQILVIGDNQLPSTLTIIKVEILSTKFVFYC